MTRSKNDISHGWVTQNLEDLAEISIGKTPSRDKDELWDRDKRTKNVWVSIKDLDQKFVNDSAEYISDSAVRNAHVRLVEKGTILLSFKLTIGKVAITNRDLFTNEAIAALRLKRDRLIDREYLYHGLHFWNLISDVDQAVKGVTLNKAKLHKIRCTFPSSLEEQRQIAAILTAVDDAIEATKALIEKQRRIKQGLMQDLLTRGVDENGELRPPREVAPQAYKQTRLGWIPLEWESDRLVNRITFPKGQVDPKVFPYRSWILIAPDHIEQKTGRLLELRTAEEQNAKSGKYPFETGDVLYSKIRPYLRKATLAKYQGLCSADMYPLKPRANLRSEFLLLLSG